MAGEDSCKVLLPDGRNVDLCTRQGSDAFLAYASQRGTFDWFSKNYEMCMLIRRRARTAGGALPARAKQQLLSTGFSAYYLARCSTPALFAEKVSDEEVKCWLDYTMTELRITGRDPRWQLTGVLDQHDAFTVNPCVFMFTHTAPTQLAMEKDFFKALSDFVSALDASLMPCADIAEALCDLTTNAYISLTMRENNPWLPEKVFKKLEASGWLTQYIKCTTTPQKWDAMDFPRGILKFYDDLLNCPAFVKKKLRRGEPCGDMVHGILAGTIGGRERMEVVLKLRAIAAHAEILQPGETGGPFRICRKCNKSEFSGEIQQSLMICSRCQRAYYCSKECQANDWKDHRKQCRKAIKGATKTSDACRQIVFNFAQKYYVAIMERVVRVCDELSISKSDILLELDFEPDGSGVAPALRYPPVFAVKESRGYFEGERPNEPDWFYKNEDAVVYEKNVETQLLTGLADQHSRMTENHLLCFVRHPGFNASYRLQLVGNDAQMLGEGAFDAFRSAIHDDDLGALSNVFGETAAKTIMLGLTNSPYSERTSNGPFGRNGRNATTNSLHRGFQRDERMKRYAQLASLFMVAVMGLALSMLFQYALQ